MPAFRLNSGLSLRLLPFLAMAWLSGVPAAHAGAVRFALPLPALGSERLAIRSWQDLKFSSTIHQKYDFSCGSAALATLLTYAYHIPVTEAAVFKSMYRHGNAARIRDEGFSLLDMKNYLARHGVPADGFRNNLATLAELRVPAIVLINYRGYHHFVVVRGIKDGQVLISDPSLGLRTQPISAFKRQWSGIFFVITADLKQARVAFNSPSVWRAVPEPPIDLAKFQLNDLALPASGMRNQSAF